MQHAARHAHSAYQQGQVAASSPLRIVVLLYDGAVRFTRQALEHFEDPAQRGHALGRAHAIVSELNVALDHDAGEDLSQSLEGLYRFVLDALIRANINHDRGAADSAIGVLETLAGSWRELERTWKPGEEAR